MQSVPDVAGRRVKYQVRCVPAGDSPPVRQLPDRPHILNVDDRPASVYARNRVLRGLTPASVPLALRAGPGAASPHAALHFAHEP